MFRRSFAIVLLLPAFAFAQDKAKLPRVLIIGDSISLGYTEPVKKQLEGKAFVTRPGTNCQHTGFGLANIEKWLGKEKWDVIHFNWGIWDTHMLNAAGGPERDESKPGLRLRHTPEQYRENLTKLVAVMEKTGAKLIFATTTPIMSRKGERFDAIKNYNTVALEVMKKHSVGINDLYEYTLPNAKEWQGGDRVHFNATGNQKLAERVSASIVAAIR